MVYVELIWMAQTTPLQLAVGESDQRHPDHRGRPLSFSRRKYPRAKYAAARSDGQHWADVTPEVFDKINLAKRQLPAVAWLPPVVLADTTHLRMAAL